MANPTHRVAVFWFRRDLRLEDNAGLYHALTSGTAVLPIFIYDRNILDSLNRDDRRVSFISDLISKLQQELADRGSNLYIVHTTPEEAFAKLCQDYEVEAVYTNRDYEPYAKKRDEAAGRFLEAKGIPFHTFKDQVIFEMDEIVKDDRCPYTVFTPYSKKWKQRLTVEGLPQFPSEHLKDNFIKADASPLPPLEAIGFRYSSYEVAPVTRIHEVAAAYEKTRNFPGTDGTTRLSPHLRFGTVSIRKIVSCAIGLSDTLLNELIWRDFFSVSSGTFRISFMLLSNRHMMISVGERARKNSKHGVQDKQVTR